MAKTDDQVDRPTGSDGTDEMAVPRLVVRAFSLLVGLVTVLVELAVPGAFAPCSIILAFAYLLFRAASRM